MNKISHLFVTKELLARYTEFSKKQKMMIMAGSILPDILIHTYIKGHTWTDRSSQVFRIIRAHDSRDLRHTASFLRYGCALHYIEDFFTWVHNSAFEGTLREHAAYEIRLYQYLVSHKNEFLRDDDMYVQDAEQLISQMKELHEEYMKTKPRLEKDRYYIMKAAGMAMNYLFVTGKGSSADRAA